MRAAEAALAERNYVSAIDVLMGLGWLTPRAVDLWRQGRVVDLERVAQANLSKLSAAMAAFRRWSCGSAGRRRRYERQGVLVEDQALVRSEQECLADEDARLRRRRRDEERRREHDEAFPAAFAGEITRLFPGCPPERADAIARHAALRRSGRSAGAPAVASWTPRRSPWPSSPRCATSARPMTGC